MTTTADSGVSAAELAMEEAQTVTCKMVALDATLIALFYQQLKEHNIQEQTARALAVVYLGRVHIYGGDE